MKPMPTTISARDIQQYYPTGSDESAVASAIRDGWALQGENLVHPSDINLDESDTDDLDFAMLTPPTRPGPCKAATVPEQDDRPVRKRSSATDLTIRDRVEAGRRGTEDHDTGRIHVIKGCQALVGWDSGVSTWADVADLRRLS